MQLRCNQVNDNADDLFAMKEKAYTSLADFKADISKFATFCRTKFPNSQSNEKSVKTLIQTVNLDLKHINMCSQCYKNGIDHENPMVELCDPPHILVWAQTTGFNYWPAKLITWKGETANVIYFGEYLEAKVPTQKCFIYSKQRPDKNAKIVNSGLFKQGLEVI